MINVDIIINALKSKFELTKNKVTSVSEESTDVEFASAKAVYDVTTTKDVSIEEDTTQTDYDKSYIIKQGGTALKTRINIPKQSPIKSGEIVEIDGVKYLRLIFTNDSYVDIELSAIGSVYGADEVTLHLDKDSKKFSIMDNYLNKVALTGSYNDLSDTPVVYTKNEVYTKEETDACLQNLVDQLAKELEEI